MFRNLLFAEGVRISFIGSPRRGAEGHRFFVILDIVIWDLFVICNFDSCNHAFFFYKFMPLCHGPQPGYTLFQRRVSGK